MYKLGVRAVVRHGINKLNEGDPAFLMKMADSNVELAFPGDNAWASMFRPVVKGREAHVTHLGVQECRAFTDSFVSTGLKYSIEDILVNGPPWKTRIAIRAVDTQSDANGDKYNNRLVSFLELSWGKLRRWEVYEDTERSALLQSPHG